MTFEIDTNLHWTDHFIKYGFAVLRNQVSREFIDGALQRIRENVEGPGRDLPFDQWTVNNVKFVGEVPGDPVLDTVYEQPNIRHIIDTMFGTSEVGTPTGWSGVPAYRVFLTPFDPDYKTERLWGGPIDFGGNMIPAFGDAFVIQVALHDTEPFGGNITVVPGSHKLVQQRAIENPLTQYPYDFDDFPFTEPYEFVAKAGDVFIMHHLCFHTGNSCGGATRKPRIALHTQAQRGSFLTLADPADPNNCPWVQSFTLNGRHEDPDDQKRYLDFVESKKSMWGVWESDDGDAYFKVYTWIDGALRAKIRLGSAPEQISRNARFDGRQLKFQMDCEPAFIGANGNGQTATLTQCRAILEIDSEDRERMICTITPEDSSDAPATIHLKRTEIITTRLPE
jgi:hypothetical protein